MTIVMKLAGWLPMTTSNLMLLLIASRPHQSNSAASRSMQRWLEEFRWRARQRPVSERKQFDEGRARLRNLKSEYTFCLLKASLIHSLRPNWAHNWIDLVEPFMVMLFANIVGRAISSVGPKQTRRRLILCPPQWKPASFIAGAQADQRDKASCGWCLCASHYQSIWSRYKLLSLGPLANHLSWPDRGYPLFLRTYCATCRRSLIMGSARHDLGSQ